MKELFLLDPAVTFLNHGSFGACPRPVFEVYQRWQRELELEPVDFIARRLPGLLAEARAALGEYVGADAGDLTFVPNATTGVNMAAAALALTAEDEVLATDLEYAACDFTWERTPARYVRAPLDELFEHVTERTRVLFVSHITSETGLLLPVAQLVARGKELGLTVVVDGAHAPAHAPLDLRGLGADFYAGNCHKWLCAPKGAGFLWVAPGWQERVSGAIVSWGQDTFLERTELQGTRDSAAYLSVPAAIDFVREHDDVERSVALCRDARRELCDLTGLPPIAPEEMVLRMASFRVPDAERIARALWEEHRVEIPWMRNDLLRLSCAMYTDREDVERLLDALAKELRTSRSPA
ncbi:MAG: aminotransferase class V-fold PLP-dependent enzyme [Actinomycetota bacterium]